MARPLRAVPRCPIIGNGEFDALRFASVMRLVFRGERGEELPIRPPDEIGQSHRQGVSLRNGIKLAGPKDDDVPASSFELGDVAFVAPAVGFDLGGPPFGAGLRNPVVLAAGMAVPETTVDENHRVMFR